MPDGSIPIERAEEIIDEQSYVASQEVSRHRGWYTKRLIVFQHDGLVGFYYLDPATEGREQEGQDCFEGDPVPIYRVTTKEVLTTIYEVPDS